jgi:uncharacterized lipoprotein YddW (UPF0748 family)
MSLRRLVGLFAALFLAACSRAGDVTAPPSQPPTAPDTAAPSIQREMRGVWIATVANIDWPSRTTLTPAQQRAELTDLFDRAANAGFNAIVFHIRPACDAVYRSSIEPWGTMLSGVQGTDPGWDPLAFAVDEAHARGLELHAWINPYRAGNAPDSTRLASNHLFRTRRDLIRIYGSQLWLDPGEPAVLDHVMGVVRDIVTRYDIDAIHADDYFYPYPVNDASGRAIDFPDSATFSRMGAGMSRADWRRANTDRFVERMYREVHALKPALKVGISPFGIWRPGSPAGVAGLDAYAAIYADSRRWLREGWVDYLAPQLYWAISAPQQSYPALLDWWLGESEKGRHVWPGLAAYRVADGTTSAFSLGEITEQVRLTRLRPKGGGTILYNATSTLKSQGGAIAGALGADAYRTRAILPASTWLDATPPSAPSVAVSGSALTLTPGAGQPARWWVLRSHTTSAWTTRVIFAAERSIALEAGVDRALVNAVDQAGNVSAPAEWRR